MHTQLAASRNEKSKAEVSPIFLRSLRLQNLLSFGPDTPALALGPLNLLVGPNGSGKSNLIEAVCLLRSSPGTPDGLQSVVRRGGGVKSGYGKGFPKAKPVLMRF